MDYHYTVNYERDGDVIVATVPVLKGCVTYGYTMEEAEKNAKEAISCHIEGLKAEGKEIPVEENPHESIQKPIQVRLAV